MLIEGIGKYEVIQSQETFSISGIEPFALGMPHIKEDFILCDSDSIALFKSYSLVLKHKKIEFNQPRVFKFKSKQSDNNKAFPFKIQSFNSIYHCTNAFIRSDFLIFEFDQQTKNMQSIINEIEDLNGPLSCINGIHSLRDEIIDDLTKNCSELKTFYKIICSDGELNVSFQSLLNSTDRAIKINKEPANNHNENSVKSPQIKSVVFEQFNSLAYSTLAKAYVNDIKFAKYNYFTHAILKNFDTFYFTILKIGNYVTVIISKKLYDFTKIFNLINQPSDLNNKDLLIKNLTKIPDLHGNVAISYQNIKSMNLKYNVPKAIFNEIVDLSNLRISIQVKSNALNDSFWFIRSFEEQIYPLTIPGLVASPLLQEMKYLLNGPYPSIFSHEKYIDGFTTVSVQWESIINSSLKNEESLWNSYIQQSPHLPDKSIRNMKDRYISTLLKTKKLVTNEFPICFESSFLLEKFYLNEPIKYKANYSYDLLTGKIEFQRSGKLNKKDALSLWMMIYPGELDLERLFNNKNVDLVVLCKRACLQKDLKMIKMILKKVDRINGSDLKIESKFTVISNIRTLFWKRMPIYYKTSQRMQDKVLKAIELDPKLFNLPLNESENVEINLGNRFKFRGELLNILRIDDLFACLSQEFLTNQVIGSIHAYLTYGNLPFPNDISPKKDTTNPILNSDFRVFINYA